MRLSAADFLIGGLTAAAVVTVVAYGAWRLRVRVVPEWSAALARTAEVTMAVAAVVLTGQMLAAVHLLRPWPTFVMLVIVGGAMAVAGTGRVPSRAGPSGPRASRPTLAILTAAGAALVAQWAAHVAVAFDGGMTQLDTLYYHGPYSARFLQDGTIGDLTGVGTSGSRLYPLDTELLHTIAAMPFGTDLLSPLLNLALLALLGTAAWAIGQPRGLGPLALLGALVAASFPAFTATQAGQASSDLAAAAFLLAAAAMLLAGDLRVPATVLAGVAAGLAVGAKLSVAAPVAVLTVGVVIVGLRRHRPAVVGWCLGLAAVVAAWFVRNWLLVDNPFPWFDLRVGPVGWRAAATEDAEPLIDTVTDLEAWRTLYLPELPQSMGRAWPIALVVLLGAAAVLLVRRRSTERVVAAAVLVSLVAHIITPQTGGVVFGNNLRFLHPALMLGGSLLALAAAGRSEQARTVLAGGLGVLVLVNLTSPHVARVPMWPGGTVPVAAALTAAAAVLAIAGAAAWSRDRDRPIVPRRVVPGVLIPSLLLVLAAGWLVQQRYLDRRYQTTDLARIDLYVPFHDLRDERVAVLGEPEVYPMFGAHLSNEVAHLTNKDRRSDLPSCLAWREALADRYDYVAVMPFFIIPMDMAADELVGDPAATVIARTDLGTVYRIDGRIATDACRADGSP